jgi:aryl-alcohol dehydrogenase-like predicted oxidoreductase
MRADPSCHATPVEETSRTLGDLVRLGKVCYVGASGYASWQLARANLLTSEQKLTRWTFSLYVGLINA